MNKWLERNRLIFISRNIFRHGTRMIDWLFFKAKSNSQTNFFIDYLRKFSKSKETFNYRGIILKQRFLSSIYYSFNDYFSQHQADDFNFSKDQRAIYP